MEVDIIQGDITKLNIDAIVNAANKSLLGGLGVDGAIHMAAGPKLRKKCQEIRDTILPEGLPTGGAVITPAYNIPVKYIIHTVGPVYRREENPSFLLRSAYKNSLNLAEREKLDSIAFPAISTGSFGYPKEDAAQEIKKVLDTYQFRSITNIILCYFNQDDLEIAKRIIEK